MAPNGSHRLPPRELTPCTTTPKVPLLEEMALLAWFESHSVKPQHYYTLLRVLLNHPDPVSMTWDDIPWDDKSLSLPAKLKELLPQEFVLMSSKVAQRFESTQHDNHTTKLLVEVSRHPEVNI